MCVLHSSTSFVVRLHTQLSHMHLESLHIHDSFQILIGPAKTGISPLEQGSPLIARSEMQPLTCIKRIARECVLMPGESQN